MEAILELFELVHASLLSSGVDVTSLAGPAYDRELDVALMLGRSHGSPRYP